MNDTYQLDARPALRLFGSCAAGCKTAVPQRGCLVIARPGWPTNTGGWVCKRCTERLPTSAATRDRVDAALEPGPVGEPVAIVRGGSILSSGAFEHVPKFAEAASAAIRALLPTGASR